MGVTTTQGFVFKLVADNVDLDLFADDLVIVFLFCYKFKLKICKPVCI